MNPLNNSAVLRDIIVNYLLSKDGSTCSKCQSVFDAGQVILQVKDVEQDTRMENLQLIHRRCMFPAKPMPKLIAKPKLARADGLYQLAQASHSEVKQGEDKQEVVKPKRLTLVCTLHVERKSEVWLARTCKHYLCAECELKRQTTGECPACLAIHTDQQASQTGSLAV